MARAKSAVETTQNNTWSAITSRLSRTASDYISVNGISGLYSGVNAAGYTMANQPQIQNRRIKAISSLPCDYTKEDIGGFIREPYAHEKELRQTAEVLKYTAYPFSKISKTVADIPTYHYYNKPCYVDPSDVKTEDFKRESRLIDKLCHELQPEKVAHKIGAQLATQGKVFYIVRKDIDRAHNKVNYAFMQQLPEDWCTIVGYNNVSGYTVSFNMMYFLRPGCSVSQFGEGSDNIFYPFLDDFQRVFEQPRGEKLIYASCPKVDCKGTAINFYPDNVASGGIGNPRVFMQNGRWAYWVTLPIDRVWTFEIDDASPAVVSPFTGLMLTYAQQSDYEAAQLSLLLNPLIKIFTATTPYFDEKNGTRTEDGFRMSVGARLLYEQFFNDLMAQNNTGGTAMFSMPANEIKSHDFTESANANEISESFNRYGIEKAGLASIIAATDDVKAAQVDASEKIESRFLTATLYPQFCRMMNHVYRQMNLKYDWQFTMFGTIFTDDTIRESANKAIANGDISAHYVLAALDGETISSKLCMMETVKESGILDNLIPPMTSYTMKQGASGSNEGGRPSRSISEAIESGTADSAEKSIDAYGEAGT